MTEKLPLGQLMDLAVKHVDAIRNGKAFFNPQVAITVEHFISEWRKLSAEFDELMEPLASLGKGDNYPETTSAALEGLEPAPRRDDTTLLIDKAFDFEVRRQITKVFMDNKGLWFIAAADKGGKEFTIFRGSYPRDLP